jgi:hypothetical protein
MGFHITGKMNGVWSHPLKLLDSYQFLLDNTLSRRQKSLRRGLALFSLIFQSHPG